MKSILAGTALMLVSVGCAGSGPPSIPADPPRPPAVRSYVPVPADAAPPADFDAFLAWFREVEQVPVETVVEGSRAVDPRLIWESFERARQLVRSVFPQVPRYPMNMFDWTYLLADDPWANPAMFTGNAPHGIVADRATGTAQSVQGQFVYQTGDNPSRIPRLTYAHERAVYCEALHGLLWLAWQERRIPGHYFQAAGHTGDEANPPPPGQVDPFNFDCSSTINEEWKASGVSPVPPLPDRWPW